MEFKFRGYNHTPSSTFPSFSDQTVKEGVWSGVQGRPEILRGSVDVRDAIQREIEKERIREEILAEEIARKRALEAEVRREIRIEREMAMQNGGGIPSPFMVGTPLSHNNWFEPGMPRDQPFALVERRIAPSFDENFGGSGRHGREIGGYVAVPFQRLPRSPEEGKKKVIELGKLKGATLSGAKRKAAPAPAPSPAGSSSSKKKTDDWSCAVCEVTATSERALNEHLGGKKHQAKMAALKQEKDGKTEEHTSQTEDGKTEGATLSGAKRKAAPSPSPSPSPAPSPAGSNSSKKKTDDLSCAVCEVTATSEQALNEHLGGKKHQAKMAALKQKKDGKTEEHTSQKEDGKTEGEHTGQQFLFWCEMCRVGAASSSVMNMHMKGKKHLKNCLKLHKKPGGRAAAGKAKNRKAETVVALEKVVGAGDEESKEKTEVGGTENI